MIVTNLPDTLHHIHIETIENGLFHIPPVPPLLLFDICIGYFVHGIDRWRFKIIKKVYFSL